MSIFPHCQTLDDPPGNLREDIPIHHIEDNLDRPENLNRKYLQNHLNRIRDQLSHSEYRLRDSSVSRRSFCSYRPFCCQPFRIAEI